MTTVKNTRARGRPPAFDREEVVQRAMNVFWANGYDAASLPLLTEGMGISTQSLYAAFGSKDALYREAIDHYQNSMGAFVAAALAACDDVLEAIARLLHDAVVTFTSSPAHPGCMITMAPGGPDEQPLVSFGRTLREESMQRVAERLRQAVNDNQIDQGTDCETVARYISAIVQGFSTQARDAVSREQLLECAAMAAASVKALLQARTD